jgi:isoleucyl-tRNA synthetase
MIENRPDWCVSRQRAWGVPITVFYCEECETMLLDEQIMQGVYQLFEEHGADIWFEKDVSELLPPDVTCKECGGHSFIKETDILDVWFDSGVSHAAVLEERPYLRWPADLYLEGSDQHRGWFHSALLTSVGTRGRAPYEAVLTHGFVVDAAGRKMSKSIGNVISPSEVIEKYGAEILRLWVSASDYREDIRISDNILKQLSDAYRRIRNTSRFLLGNLYDFDPAKDAVAYEDMVEIDRLALHKLQRIVARARQAYDAYEFHVIYHALFNYCTLDLSAFYLDILKDRLYTSPPDSVDRKSAQTVLHIQVDTIARLMAPILPFTADEIWQHMPCQNDGCASIHMSQLPEVNPAYTDDELAARWEYLLNIRGEVTKKLEEARAQKLIGHPLDARVTITAGGDAYDALQPYDDELRSILIVSKAKLVKDDALKGTSNGSAIEGVRIDVDAAPGDKCERCWVHDTTVGTNQEQPSVCQRCQEALAQISSQS